MDTTSPQDNEQQTSDEKLDKIDKRIGDLKSSIGNYIIIFCSFLGAFVAIFGIIAVVFQINFSSERSDLRTFKKEIKDELLGSKKEPARIEFYTVDFKKLENSTIEADQKLFGSNKSALGFKYMIKNTGGSPTGSMYQKILTKDPLILEYRSAVEGEYQYESIIEPGHIKPHSLPVGFSTDVYTTTFIQKLKPIDKGTYPVSIYIYYGEDKVSKVNFNVSISPNENYYYHTNTSSTSRRRSNLLVFDENGYLLHGQDVKAYVFNVEKDSYKICFGYTMKNIGKSYGGLHAWEVFTKKPLVLGWEAYGVEGFDYQSGQFGGKIRMHFNQFHRSSISSKVLSSKVPEIGIKYPAMLKLAYGNSISYWKFNLLFSERKNVVMKCDK